MDYKECKILPKKEECPACPRCSGRTKPVNDNTKKIKWIWRCENRSKSNCQGMVNPLTNTFFQNVKLTFKDVFILAYCFVIKLGPTFAKLHMDTHRKSTNRQELGKNTITDVYSFFREVAEVFAFRDTALLGGPGKTILIDETFLTKRKYNRGRRIKTMTQTVLGIYCREDKDGRFFLVDGKKKINLWPYVRKHCHPGTPIICTDSAKQYINVDLLFDDAIHKSTNHSKGQFVDLNDRLNTINPLENENKHFKNSLKSRRTKKLTHQYMALHFYRRTRMKGGVLENVIQFLQDVAALYPGYGKEGLSLLELEQPTVESEGIKDLINHKDTTADDAYLSDSSMHSIAYVDDVEGDPDWKA